jgi:hypothetical protein
MNFPINLTNPLCLDNIKTCCAASQLAYAQLTITDSISGESVLIQDCGDCALIAFPGTHDLRDVLRDIDCLRIATLILGQPCAVHAGFDRTLNALIAKIVERVPAAGTSSNAESVTPSPRGPRCAGRITSLGELIGGGLGKPLGRGEGDHDNGTPASSSKTSAQSCQFGIRSGDFNISNVAAPFPLINEESGEKNQLKSLSSKISGHGSALFLTGHSKGAAVARRCALALLEKNFPVAGLITFGEPRGGDARYAAICDRALADRTLRITNAADPVPWMPAWLAGNRHCGSEAWLPPNPQSPIRDPQLVFGPRLWCQLLLNSAEIFRAWQLKDLAPLADHHIDNYLRRIDAL